MKFQNGKMMYFESYRKLGGKLLVIINIDALMLLTRTFYGSIVGNQRRKYRSFFY